jgi:UDP-N-acetyl-D-glucosamine dehydrogenase
LTAEQLAGYDVVLIATDHDQVDYALLAKSALLIVDTRNVFARLSLAADHILKA